MNSSGKREIYFQSWILLFNHNFIGQALKSVNLRNLLPVLLLFYFSSINIFGIEDAREKIGVQVVLQNPENSLVRLGNKNQWIPGPVQKIKSSLDNQFVAIQGYNDIRIYEKKLSQPYISISKIVGRGKKPLCFDLSLNKNLFVVGTNSGEVFIWNLETKKQTFHFKHSDAFINSVALSPDGSKVAISSSGKNVFILNRLSKKIIAKLRKWDGDRFAMTFSPDGKSLISSHRKGEIVYWDVKNFKEYKAIKIEGETVSSLEFSSNSKYLVVTSCNVSVNLKSNYSS